MDKRCLPNFREAMPKYSSQTTDFNLFLFSSKNSLTDCFIYAFDFSNICMQSRETQWVLVLQNWWNSIWMACVLHPDVKCYLLKVWEKGPAAAQTCPDPAVCALAGDKCLKQPEKKCCTPKSSELQNNKQNKKPSFIACMTLFGHLSLQWMKSIFSTKEGMSRKAI